MIINNPDAPQEMKGNVPPVPEKPRVRHPSRNVTAQGLTTSSIGCFAPPSASALLAASQQCRATDTDSRTVGPRTCCCLPTGGPSEGQLLRTLLKTRRYFR